MPVNAAANIFDDPSQFPTYIDKFPGRHQDLLLLLKEKKLADVRNALIGAAAPGPNEYNWLEALKQSTERAIGDYLGDNKPDEKAYDPNLFDEHINAASGLLDRCIARRTELHNLEAQTFSTALGYMLEEELQPGALAVAKLGLKATRLQASAGPEDADESILLKHDVTKTRVREMRLKMHAQDGHALNYSQRIAFLRELQGDDIRTIYELLFAAERGLEASVGIELPPVPTWNPDKGNNLQLLVKWTLRAVRFFDLGRKWDRIVTRVLRLGADGIFSEGGEALRQILANPPGYPNYSYWGVDFTLTKDNLLPIEGFMRIDGVPRILSIGFALEFESGIADFDNVMSGTADDRAKFSFQDDFLRAQRSQMAFSCSIKTPIQRASSSEWKRPTLNLKREVGIWDGFGGDSIATVRPAQVRNTNPLGGWQILLYNEYAAPGHEGTLSALTAGNGKKLWQLRDLVLKLRLAVR